MPKELSRKWRLWLTVGVQLFVPWVFTMTGWTGFWPTLGVCSLAIAWSLFLFRSEISRMRIVPDQNSLINTENPWWLFLPGIVLLLTAATPFVVLHERATHEIQPLGFEDVLQSYMHDRSVYISDLARTDAMIEDKVFERVTFVGPAMVGLFGGDDMSHLDIIVPLGMPASSAYLEVPLGTPTIGIIGFRNCVFKHCKFERIQLIGPKETIDQFKAALNPTILPGNEEPPL